MQMKKIGAIALLSAGLVLAGCGKEGEKGGSGTLTLSGPDKVSGNTIILNSTMSVHFIQGFYGASIDCIDEQDNLVLFSVILPTMDLPAQTTTYNIVSDPGIDSLAANEVYLSYGDVNNSTIISYTSINEGKTLTLSLTNGKYSFSVTNVRMEEGLIYTDGPATYFLANGSFEFTN